jgi:hypothetical protein
MNAERLAAVPANRVFQKRKPLGKKIDDGDIAAGLREALGDREADALGLRGAGDERESAGEAQARAGTSTKS